MLAAPMIAMPGGWELVLIVFVLILLFGAKKLPELARGTGRSLRIFKSETRGLMDDDDDRSTSDDAKRDQPREVTSGEGPDARAQTASPTSSPTSSQSSEEPNPTTHRAHGEP